MDIQTILNESEIYLKKSETSEISLGWRVRLWSAINKKYPESSLKRRSILAFKVVKSLLPLWNQIKHNIDEELREVPIELLNFCKECIIHRNCEGETNLDTLESFMRKFYTLGPSTLVPLAAYAARRCAKGKEDTLYDDITDEEINKENFINDFTDYDIGDWVGTDTYYWAAAVHGSFDSEDYYDPDARRKFWLKWLHEDVPSVLVDMDSVLQILK